MKPHNFQKLPKLNRAIRGSILIAIHIIIRNKIYLFYNKIMVPLHK